MAETVPPFSIPARTRVCRSGNGPGDDPVRLDPEADRFDFPDPVCRLLPDGRNGGLFRLSAKSYAKHRRLSHLLSGNSAESGSCILASPFNAGFCVGGPFFVDLDKDGTDGSQERVVAGEDPDLYGAPFQFLPDCALHRV